MIQLPSMDDYKLCAHAARKLKRLLLGKVSDDHSEDTLEATGTLERNPTQLLEKSTCILRWNLAQSYSSVSSTVQVTSNLVAYKRTGIHKNDTALLPNHFSLLKSGLRNLHSSQSYL